MTTLTENSVNINNDDYTENSVNINNDDFN